MRGRTIEIIQHNDAKVRETWSRLGSEVALMEARGYGLRDREEHVFKRLRSLEIHSLNEQSAGGFDLFRGIKRTVAEKIADVVGLQPGFLRDIITNFVAGLGIADLKSFLSPGACKPIVTKLAAAVQGAIVDNVLQTLNLRPENFFAVAITEAIKSGFVSDGPFVKMASETICKIKLSDLLPGGKGLKGLFTGTKAADAAGTASAAETPAAAATTTPT